MAPGSRLPCMARPDRLLWAHAHHPDHRLRFCRLRRRGAGARRVQSLPSDQGRWQAAQMLRPPRSTLCERARPGGDTAWVVTDEKSPLDDSPLVSAALASTDNRSHLLLRCKDRRTEVAVSMTGFIKCGADVRVVYRIDQAQAVERPWRSHPSCYLALDPTPIPFIRALADNGKVFVRMYDNHDAPNDASFSLGNVSKIRSRLAEACQWDAASTSSGSAAPCAPAPAAAPGAPREPPK